MSEERDTRRDAGLWLSLYRELGVDAVRPPVEEEASASPQTAPAVEPGAAAARAALQHE